MLCFSRGLVLIQHNGLLCAAAGAVQPHVGLAGRGTSRLFQHLQGRLVGVQHRLLTKLLAQRIVDKPASSERVGRIWNCVAFFKILVSFRCRIWLYTFWGVCYDVAN